MWKISLAPALLASGLQLACTTSGDGGLDPGDSAGGGTTTWTTGSTETLAADLTISAGETLVIEPGVTVQIAAGVWLTVEGELVARGTTESPIIFEGSGADRWGGLVFEDSALDAEFEALDEYLAGSIIEHCQFSGATNAVKITGASPFIHQSTFDDNESEAAFELPGGAAILITEGGEPRIAANTFRNNVAGLITYGGAIYAEDSDPIIQDNLFDGNSSIYGGALSTDMMAGPIVGNTFRNNEADTKGGAMALVSGASAVLNNLVENNLSGGDGGGVHVCVDCFPHAKPFFLDNTITGNVNDSGGGAGGLGAAHIRVAAYNNIHDNLRSGAPADFAWFHHLDEGYPDWAANPSIAHNWWGSTDPVFLAETVYDGNDNAEYGVVTFDPVLSEPVTTPETRVTITTRKIRYQDIADPMPVFLTLYNPGDAREVELVIAVQYDDGPVFAYGGELDYPDAQKGEGSFSLSLPQNGVYFTKLLEPTYAAEVNAEYGVWHASLFDSSTGARLGDVCSSRVELGPPAGVPGTAQVGVSVGGQTVNIGDTYGAVKTALGTTGGVRDLAAAGTFFFYAGDGISGLLTGDTDQDTVTAIFLGPAFAGELTNGISSISGEAEVDALLGQAAREPFLGMSWYRDAGIGIAWESSVAARIYLF